MYKSLCLEFCHVKRQKRRHCLRSLETKLCRAKQLVKMKTEEYQNIASKSVGIEGIPLVLRRKYNTYHLPIRGLMRSKVCLGFKISVINCRRLIKYLLNATKKAYSSLFHNYLLEIFCFQRLLIKNTNFNG